MQFEDFALKTNVLAFASRSKAKAKPRRRSPACSSTRTVPIGERIWTDIEPQDYSSIAYPVSKQLSTLLRHGDQPRAEGGAIEFLRLKDYLRNEFVHSQHWSGEMWKSTTARVEETRKDFNVVLIHQDKKILYLRALQGHSGRKLIDPSLTGQCINSEQFLRVHFSHRMCNQFTFHHEFRIDTGRTELEQKTDGILFVCGSYEQRKQRSE